MKSKWMEILQQVKSGKMRVDEAAQRLEDLEIPAPGTADFQPAIAPNDPPITPQPEDIQPDLGWWQNSWLVPYWVGLCTFVAGAVLLGWAFSSSQSLWFACSWLPMLFGMGVLFLGWWSRQARWMHVRVQNADGSRFAISIPLPLRFSAWVLRVVSPLIPQLREKNLDNLPDMIEALATSDGPLSVEVDEEDGERVRVYIL